MKPYNKRKQHGRKKEFKKQFEDAPSVPRFVDVAFRKLDIVKEVKPLRNSDEMLNVIVLVKDPDYNYKTHEKILQVEHEVQKMMRPRQVFEASISW